MLPFKDLPDRIKSPAQPTDRKREEMIPQVLSAGHTFESWMNLEFGPVNIDSVESLEEALQQLQYKSYGAAIFSLPHFGTKLTGFLDRARDSSPLTPFILLADPVTEEIACRLSVREKQIFCLPANASRTVLQLAIGTALHEYDRKRTWNKTLQNSINGTLSSFLEILSLTDPYSASLGQRLRYAVEAFAKTAGLPLTWELETAAMLSEAGVLTIPMRVLLKHNSGQDLSGFEKEMIARVPERGADLLQQIPFLEQVAKIIRYSQKHFDGAGFPSDSVAGERLPTGSRILKVLSDLFRLEDGGLTRERALEQMAETEGKYDRKILAVARDCYDVDLPERIPSTAQLVTLKELRPGHLLVAGVETKDGVLLIREGQIVSPKVIHKLRNFACMSGIREPIHVIDLLESRKMISVFQDLAHSETSFFTRRNGLASTFAA